MDAARWDTEDFLLERAIQRDSEAFAGLYDIYAGRVYKHVYYRLYDRGDAEDITQEVFLKAWKAIARYRRTGAPFVAWLITIAHNLLADHHRQKRRHVTLEQTEALSASPHGDPMALDAHLNSAEVRHAISKLKGDKQKVIIMHFIDGFSYEEIASALGKTEGAVRVIQYRALKDLKRILEPDGRGM